MSISPQRPHAPAAVLASLCSLVAVPSTATAGEPCGPGELFTPFVHDLPFDPAQMFVHDVNDDGLVDLVASGRFGLEVRLALGGGTFEREATLIETPSLRLDFEFADFDGDGVTDLLSSHSSDPYMAFRRGVGDGTFAEAETFLPSSSLAGFEPYDVDGDGILDLVFTGFGPAHVRVLPGLGDGTFGDAISTVTSASGGDPIVSDLNGDGEVDVVLTNSLARLIMVGLGVGDGTFVMTDIPAGPDSPSAPASADFDGDGVLDLIHSVFSRDRVDVRLGDGLGGFSAPIETDIIDVDEIAVADFDGDGIVDLAISKNGLVGRLHLGVGDGTFVPGPPIAIDRRAKLASGELDGRPGRDLVAMDEGILILPNAGDGTFPSGDVRIAVEGRTSVMETVDINGDGRLDVGVFDESFDRISLFLATDDELGFAPRVDIDVAADSFYLAVGDVDSNGTEELLTANWSTGAMSIIGDTGNGIEVLWSVETGTTIGPPALADLDGDGHPDLIYPIRSASGIAVRRGLGNGAFAAGTVFESVDGGNYTAFADLDDDGDLDLVIGGAWGALRVHRNDGDGGFGESFLLDPQWAFQTRALELIDIDRDGILDLFVRTSDELIVLPGLGGGAFGPADILMNTEFRSVALVDLDGDGLRDIAGALPASPPVKVFRGLPEGGFDGPETVATVGANVVLARDLAGDGRPELLAHGQRETVSVLQIACAHACPTDLDGSGSTDFADLLTVLTQWGPCPTRACDGDVDDDGVVGFADVVSVLAAWGPCSA